MIVAQLSSDRPVSTYVGGLEMIVAHLTTDRSIYTCVGSLLLILTQLLIALYVGILMWEI
jgi:hypothetical protein